MECTSGLTVSAIVRGKLNSDSDLMVMPVFVVLLVLRGVFRSGFPHETLATTITTPFGSVPVCECLDLAQKTHEEAS